MKKSSKNLVMYEITDTIKRDALVPEGVTVREFLDELSEDYDIDNADVSVSSTQGGKGDPMDHRLRYGDIITIKTSSTDLEHTDEEFDSLIEKLAKLPLAESEYADDEGEDDYEDEEECEDDEDYEDLDDEDLDEDDDSDEEDDTSEEELELEADIVNSLRRLLKARGCTGGTLKVKVNKRSGEFSLTDCK